MKKITGIGVVVFLVVFSLGAIVEHFFSPTLPAGTPVQMYDILPFIPLIMGGLISFGLVCHKQ